MRLVAENLSVARGDRPVFSDLSLAVQAGEALIVTGDNGSGKSTLLTTIAGFLKPASGIVRIEGAGDAEAAIHYLGHLNALKPVLTVAENLGFWRSFLASPDAEVESALDEVGLGGLGDLQAGYLSAGQKRRVAIARLLVSYRPLWLVDEPTATLDSHAEALFGAILARHLGRGGMAVAATHHKLAIDSPKRLDMNRYVAGRYAGATA